MATSRRKATALREQVELALATGPGALVVLDFEGVFATQPFVDSMLGVLVLRHGPGALERIVLKACCLDTKATVRFVVNDRAGQFREAA